MSKKWLQQMAKLDGAVTDRERDIHDTVLRTGSPAVDFTYGNKWGLPLGYAQCIFGPPKGGKSLFSYAMTAQCHKDYDDGIVIKIDTEFRDQGQMNPAKAQAMGIDLDRFMTIQTNTAAGVFDQIETKIAKMCQDGMPLKLLIIDSINGIMGRRMSNAETIDQVLIGDMAQTLQDGFKRIMPVQRRHNFSVLLTAQVRAEMDMHEQQRGNKYKMAASFGVQHYAEYFTFIERMRTKAGSVDAMGREFTNEDRKDMSGKADRTGHKIKVVMKDNSLGVAGREGIMTFDYARGLINQHEELFDLANKRGVFDTAGTWYSFGGVKHQKAAMLQALEKEKELSARVLAALMDQEKDAALAAMLTPPNTEGLVPVGPEP